MEKMKLQTEELGKINEFRNKFSQKFLEIGELHVTKKSAEDEVKRLQDLEEKLMNDFSDIRKEEREFFEEVSKKYGPGNLDINTGEFTPAPQPEATPEPVEAEEVKS